MVAAQVAMALNSWALGISKFTRVPAVIDHRWIGILGAKAAGRWGCRAAVTQEMVGLGQRQNRLEACSLMA